MYGEKRGLHLIWTNNLIYSNILSGTMMLYSKRQGSSCLQKLLRQGEPLTTCVACNNFGLTTFELCFDKIQPERTFSVQ